MGKPKGFLEFDRELPRARDPRERIADWEEFHGHATDEGLKRQGARCMDCGIPFCHVGIEIAGAASGCPINNLIPEWNDLVYQGLWREAYERLSKTNNFPEFTGRVCPAPCERSCVLGINAPPVTIKNIELAIAEKAFEQGWVGPSPPAVRTDKRVAVIGSGPAGLSCAAQLNQAGHRVTVFERDDRVGGLLTYGIPNMKLDKRLVERRVATMEAEGIVFRVGTEVGKDLPAEQLLGDFDAIVLCGGATRPRDLQIEGRELSGICFAMDFLRESTRSLLNSGLADKQFVTAAGKNVIVIGGGDTGTDCVATALRLGCKSLVQLEILEKPPEQRSFDNPWPQWDKIFRVDYGQEECHAIFGRDPREFAVMTERFVGDEAGCVKGLQTVRVEWKRTEAGQLVPVRIPGTEQSFPADLVLLAMGFLGPETSILAQLGVELDARSNAKADFEDYRTNVPGVFTAGDMRRGQSLVVWAIREGRGAARECDRFLMGETQLP